MNVFTLGDLRVALSPLSLVRRKAILFALDAPLPLSRVVTLRWCQTRTAKLPPISRAILMSVPRHLTFDYVFWEYLPDARPTPVFQLEYWLRQAAGMGMDDLRGRYERMLWVDTEIDAADFKRQFSRAG